MEKTNGLRRIVLGMALAGAAFSSACATAASTSTTGAGGGGGAGAVVLVAGATGGTGQEVVKQAVAKGYKVRVLVRDEAKAREEFGDSVTYVVGNVREPATLPAAVKGARYVVSALGSNVQRDPQNKPELVDYQGVKALADAAKAAGVQHFVLVSSMGVTDKENPLNKMFDRILEWKLKGEDALRASGVPYTVVRPGGLRDDAGGKKGIKAMQGDPKIRGQIPRADVAAVCVNALGNKAAAGKTFEIISDDASSSVDWTAFWSGIKPDAGA